MKTPRISDFDPNAKVPELRSSLDRMPAIEKPDVAKQAQHPQTITSRPPSEQQNMRKQASFPRAAGDPAKRAFVRRTFDFYEDQISYLTRVSLEEKLAGNERSMNEMVREALDDWIKKKTT